MKNRKFEEFFRKYRNLVIRLALNKTGDYQAAQEICQRVFVSFYQHMEAVDEDLVKAWLVKSTRNAVIDYFRKQQSMPIDDIVLQELESMQTEKNLEACEERMMYRDLAGRILREVKARNEGWYEVLMLHCVDGLSYVEMETQLQVPESVLRARLHRARNFVREQFWEEYAQM